MPPSLLTPAEAFHPTLRSQSFERDPDQIEPNAWALSLKITNTERSQSALYRAGNELRLGPSRLGHLPDALLEFPVGGLQDEEQVVDIFLLSTPVRVLVTGRHPSVEIESPLCQSLVVLD